MFRKCDFLADDAKAGLLIQHICIEGMDLRMSRSDIKSRVLSAAFLN